MSKQSLSLTNNPRFFWGVFFTLLFLSGLLATVNLKQDLKDELQAILLPENRQVVGKVQADLSGSGDYFIVIKVLTRSSLALEVYRLDETSQQTHFVQRLILPEKRDAFLTISGQATNLAVVDMDSDGQPEVIAPAYDENLVPRLNYLIYDKNSQSFQQVTK